MNYLLALALLSAAGNSYAQDAAPSLLTAPPAKTAGLNETVKYAAKDGYHFNLKAPQECGATEAFDLSRKELKCKFTSGGEQAVSLKICDDKETACMFEDFTVLVRGEGKRSAAAVPEASIDTGLDGFLLNAPAAARRAEQKTTTYRRSWRRKHAPEINASDAVGGRPSRRASGASEFGSWLQRLVRSVIFATRERRVRFRA